MGNQGASFTSLYHQLLVDPRQVDPADLEQLLARYPYSKPLYFSAERRRFLKGEEKGRLGNRAVLLADHANWLAEYVQLPVEEIPVVEVEDDDYVPFEDISSSPVVEDQEEDIVEAIEEETMEAGSVEEEAVREEDQQIDALETLVQEGIGGGDYFALHTDNIAFEVPEQKELEVEDDLADEERKAENISLYNDELMPYSFRWWLHKTRLEHADTYQPFAGPRLPVTSSASFDPAELDRVILDQQIREHIIHLQHPEDKLSEEVKQRESAEQGVNKVSEVIDRFIREEPQIQPPQAEQLNVENKARKSSEEQFDLVTETLAGIYADQAMYVKAIEVYKKLILRFPEKKSYFATQIKELEEKLY